jgi:hypothetical protein
MQLLGRDVPVAGIEQQARERQALARRPQADGAQFLEYGTVGFFVLHGRHMEPIQTD